MQACAAHYLKREASSLSLNGVSTLSLDISAKFLEMVTSALCSYALYANETNGQLL